MNFLRSSLCFLSSKPLAHLFCLLVWISLRIPWASRDLRMGRTHKADSQERIQEPEPRSGSDSNARKPRKSPEVHESDETRRQPPSHPKGYDLEHDYQHDLEVAHRPAEDGGLGAPYVVGEG